MKFHKKYPKANLHQEVEPSVVKFRHLEPCWNCGELTEYRQIDFDMPLCSHECVKAKTKELQKSGGHAC
jgi:hypothetical protein